MRVALAIMSLEVGGGTEHDIVHLSAGLKKAGHEPLVITSGGRLCEDVRAEGVEVAICPLLARRPVELWRNGRRLADLIEAHQIDVLNPQGVYPGLSGYLATRRLLRRGRKVPNVVTIHNLERLEWWYYKLGALALNRIADHVIVESECERKRLQARGMRRPLTVLHNCFPPDRFASVEQPRDEIRRAMNWPEDRIVFIMPARLRHEKAHDIVFQALARDEVRRLPILVYLAGDGPEEAGIRDKARQLGVEDRVFFGGFRRDLPILYKAADVFLLPSRYESLPLSIREGMTASLPVLATDVGGISEAVEDGRSGLLVPPEDPTALAAAMIRMASDAVLRGTMGRRGFQIIQEKFDYDHWIKRTVEVMSAVRQEFSEPR